MIDGSKIEATGGNFVIVDDPKQEVSRGGIIIAETAQKTDKIVAGTILAVSDFLMEDGSYHAPPGKPGQRCVYGQHAGAGSAWEYVPDGTTNKPITYRLIKWNEICGFLKV